MKRIAYLKQVSERIEKGVDKDGVINDYKTKQKVLVPSKGFEYSMWYCSLTPIISDISELSVLKVLVWLCNDLKFNDYEVNLSKYYKEKIVDEMKISFSAVGNAIGVLRKYNIIIPVPGHERSAIYFLNPEFVWKGYTAERSKAQKKIFTLLERSQLPEKEKTAIEDVERFRIAEEEIRRDLASDNITLKVSSDGRLYCFGKCKPAKEEDEPGNWPFSNES